VSYIPEKPDRCISIILYKPIVASGKFDTSNFHTLCESSMELFAMAQVLRRHGASNHMIIQASEKEFIPSIEGQVPLDKSGSPTLGTVEGQEFLLRNPHILYQFLQFFAEEGISELSFFDLLQPEVFSGVRGKSTTEKNVEDEEKLQAIYRYQSPDRPALDTKSRNIKNHFSILQSMIREKYEIFRRLALFYTHQNNEMMDVLGELPRETVPHLIVEDDFKIALLEICAQRNWGVLLTQPTSLPKPLSNELYCFHCPDERNAYLTMAERIRDESELLDPSEENIVRLIEFNKLMIKWARSSAERGGSPQIGSG
jgi:hypothetical protein